MHRPLVEDFWFLLDAVSHTHYIPTPHLHMPAEYDNRRIYLNDNIGLYVIWDVSRKCISPYSTDFLVLLLKNYASLTISVNYL